jgi:hypothetical protein
MTTSNQTFDLLYVTMPFVGCIVVGALIAYTLYQQRHRGS